MKRLLILGLVAALFLLAGCSSSSSSSGNASSSPAPAGGQPSAPKTIKVGLIAPITGDAKTFGESTRKGVELALEQAQYKAGDYKIELVVGDDHKDSTEGVNVATKMITQDGVKAIIGSVTSGVTIPISEVANAHKVVEVTGTATNPAVTVDAQGNRKPYIFRACFIDPFQGKIAAKFALETLKVKRAAILTNKSQDYSVGLADAFKQNFTAGGGQVVAEASYTDQDTDFSAILTKVAQDKPDFLYLPDYYNKVSLIGKQAKSAGLTGVVMMGGDGWDSADLDYASLAGGYFTNHYSPDDQRPEVQQFVKDFKAKYNNETPDALATLGYDATKILLAGIAKANSDDTDKIRDAIQNLKDFKVVSGTISYDKDGNPLKQITVLQVQADKTQKFIAAVLP